MVRSRVVVVLFSLTIFLGASLIFIVEPMTAKGILPLLGGSPAVWNTAMVFFQAALLAGYAAAHLLGRAGRRTQVGGYALGVAAPIVASLLLRRMVVDLPRGWSGPTHDEPALWALGLLAAMVGLPFVVLAAAGPLLQRWFAGMGRRASRDPYFLYVASNAGSMAGLLAYPLLLEPLLGLEQQRWAWSLGFGGFAALTAVCGGVYLRSRGGALGHERPTHARKLESVPAAVTAPNAAPSRVTWVLLALVPSSLMLGVTQYLSTDIAAVPLLWVVPLAVYLLTFIVAFARPPLVRSAELGRLLPLVLVALVVAFMARGYHMPPAALATLHLLGLLIIGLWCHSRLAESRPGAERLTEFYLWVAVGGVLGGSFNALIAPLIFPMIAEYPLMIGVVCVLRAVYGRQSRVAPGSLGPEPGAPEETTARPELGDTLLDAAVATLIGTLAATLDELLRRGAFAAAVKGLVNAVHAASDSDASVRLGVSVGVPALALYLCKKRPARFAMVAAAVLIAALIRPTPGVRLLHIERTFFGVYRVERNTWETWLNHGTTLHGLQWLDPSKRRTPLSYYHPDGPAGSIFRTYGPTLGSRVGLVGMGTGALAAYAKPGQRYTFHEIDPAVVRIAENPAWFTFLSDCRASGAAYDVTLGDGRLTMARVPDGEYGIIVLDAFSSDSIPVHLLTREAMSLYLKKVRPGGVLAYHVSNQYMRLAPVVGREAADLGASALVWEDDAERDELVTTGRYPSVWVAVARTDADLEPLAGEGRWRRPKVSASTPLWTDDYSDVLGVMGKE